MKSGIKLKFSWSKNTKEKKIKIKNKKRTMRGGRCVVDSFKGERKKETD